MKKSTIVIILNTLVILGYILLQTISQERLIRSGELVLFKLRPVDPRSIMQGDYMILRYEVTDYGNSNILSKKGYLVFTKNEDNIAQRVRFQDGKFPLSDGERIIQYSITKGEISIGSEAYFFQEGIGKKFENAQYGAMRVDGLGNATLVGLYGKDKKLISASD